MGRHKTLSDERLLGVAREAFRRRGFEVPGREIARLAGVSEAVLYQRFESKDALFFAAMAPTSPDLEKILGPREPEGDPRAWIRGAVEKIAEYFQELLPLAIPTLLHPGPGPAREHDSGIATIAGQIKDELELRLASLQKRREITAAPSPVVVRLLIGMAFDWALHRVLLSPGAGPNRPSLGAMVDVAWAGISPGPGLPPRRRAAGRATPAPRRRAGRKPV